MIAVEFATLLLYALAAVFLVDQALLPALTGQPMFWRLTRRGRLRRKIRNLELELRQVADAQQADDLRRTIERLRRKLDNREPKES